MDYEAKDWELNPHLYLQDKDGNFVKNKDGTPRKKVVDLLKMHKMQHVGLLLVNKRTSENLKRS